MYGRGALNRLREQQSQAQPEPEHAPSLLDQIPVDAEMDDATLTVWNGERWVAWGKWLATGPLIREDQQQETKAEERNGESSAERAADLPPQSAGVQERLW